MAVEPLIRVQKLAYDAPAPPAPRPNPADADRADGQKTGRSVAFSRHSISRWRRLVIHSHTCPGATDLIALPGPPAPRFRTHETLSLGPAGVMVRRSDGRAHCGRSHPRFSDPDERPARKHRAQAPRPAVLAYVRPGSTRCYACTTESWTCCLLRSRSHAHHIALPQPEVSHRVAGAGEGARPESSLRSMRTQFHGPRQFR